MAEELKMKTLIVIAHRLSTMEGMDAIYVFERGTILERGGFHELLSDQNSLFCRLSAAQGDLGVQP
jgi:ABC-type multidrug transport system fused ATPase/permease subunit